MSILDLQNCDVAKDRFERLVQDVAHLVFKVLRRNKRIEQISPEHAFERDNLPARSTDRRVDVESFPQVVDGVRTRLSSHIKQYTNADDEQ